MLSVTKRTQTSGEPITIKKYANRRLYNTSASTYVTLDDLATMVKEGDDFEVKDAKTGEDITHTVLTQIIFEEENKGQNLLPINFLRQLIKFYGDSMQAVVPSYLEYSIDSLSREQEKFQQQFGDAFSAAAFPGMEEQVKQNMVMFQKTMQMFNPFVQGGAAGGVDSQAPQPAADDKPEDAKRTEELRTLRDQLQTMQDQINKLAETSN
ncbi:MAG: polyhydroxyalkanoate synthesis repressor PhaR [Alphaproteobacteria bacterium]|nr:polyhydroxyalkanoate synthesis repressor PhaR [Alphaproteobacteria bacterium]